MAINWYARQLSNFPVVIILGAGCLSFVFTITSILSFGFPSFKDPILGFESRGTELSQRTTAWKHLMENSGWNGSLSMYPTRNENQITSRRDDSRSYLPPLSANATTIILENEKESLNEFINGRMKNNQANDRSNFFCKDPGRGNVRVVFQSSVENSNLFTLKSLLSICDLDYKKLRNDAHFIDLCSHDGSHDCCRSWSLPNYVALLTNHSYCKDITRDDVSYVLKVLKNCAGFYHDLKLSHDCTSNPNLCGGVPHECTRHNAVYNILHFLADSKFLISKRGDESSISSVLTYTTVFLPIHQGIESLDYYYDLQQKELTDGVTEVIGMEFGLKHVLLEHGLYHDAIFAIIAVLVVFLCIWMFTTSFLLTLMTAIALTSALGTTYFVYTAVFRIPYFPLMNVLSVIILIVIVTTDVFVYSKTWLSIKTDKSNGITTKIVRDTLQQFCPSMLINNITIAAALYSNMCSSVTVVRCFSIFTGTAVIVNMLLTLIWLPASLIIIDRWFSSTCCICIPPFGIYLPYFQKFQWCSYGCNILWKFHYGFTDSSRVFFEKILPCLIIKPRWFWLIILTSLAMGSAVVVFFQPALLLPISKEMQIFGSEHPFEKYDLLLKQLFWYEKESDHQTYHNLPIRIVWGVLPVDNGHYLNPHDRGNLVVDRSFLITSRESQEWLLSFCKKLHNQTFCKPTSQMPKSSCFIENFKYWMERMCVDGVSHQNRTPCCQTSKFPYSADVFNLCIGEIIGILHYTPSYIFTSGVAGPRFSKETGDVGAIVIEYGSTVSSTGTYEEIKEFVTSVDNWMKSALKDAPAGMKNGWFVSDMDFYNLQSYLSSGTLAIIGVAVGAVSLSLLVTTMNLLIAFCLIVTTTSVVLVTLASFIILEWRLQTVETVLITVTTGLSVDLSIRYGTSYRNSPQDDKEGALVYSLSRLSSPIAMAAVSYFLAGIILLPTSIIAFLQIGVFLINKTIISWIYSTFYLHSLLSVLSPCRDYFQNKQIQHDKSLYALSESTVSTSSISCPSQVQVSCDHHQLEPLSVNRIGTRRNYSKKGRSGSLSLFKCDDPSWYGHPKKPSRKVSLPVVHVSNPIDPSPRHVSGATSATTLVGVDDDRDSVLNCRKEQEMWSPTEILV
ncbi:protein dispatched homolog 1-like isoform X2 [Centruroides sculpturatus]|nr:protein dispatched homolog 1-like isoform X2 [Centruroides sculpturatus]